MRVLAFYLLMALGAVSAAPMSVSAATLDFNFSFTNSANGGGFVKGIVRGLSDNAGTPATSVEITSNTLGFGLGEYVGNNVGNFFNVLDGKVQFADFTTLGIDNPETPTGCCSLRFSFFAPSSFGFAGLSSVADAVPVSFPSDITFSPVAPVPLPASILLLTAAVAGLVGVGVGKREA